MTRTVNVHEAKTHLSRLLDDVEAGEEIVLARSRLVPLAPVAGRKLGFLKIDLGAAFFEPLDEQELAAWE
jgi:antitoxin (DNA-binding transcriptional repressor) of toxin-antitoxin stability system